MKAGKLPPVDKRLPENPLVVPVVEKTGEYGGVWRRAFLGPADANNYVRVVYDALFRFSPDGAKIEPKIAEGAEPSADYKVWTLKLRKGEYVFPGPRSRPEKQRPWHRNIFKEGLLRPMGYGHIDPHGFRSTFRDWAGETTNHANHVVEMALAHKVGNAVEAAYRRGDLFEKRRALMSEWAAFCEAPASCGGGRVMEAIHHDAA